MQFVIGTPRITTGNVRTTYDPITPAQTSTTVGQVPGYVYQNQACAFGTTFIDVGGTDSVSGTTTQLPLGQMACYKYVLYKSTTNPTMVAYPGVVYYVDETGLVVSGAQGDGFIAQTTAASCSDVAGYMMLNTTDNSTVTKTLLNNSGYGSGVWICIGGFVKAATGQSGSAAGDFFFGYASTAFTPHNVAGHSGTVIPDRQLGVALTSYSSGTQDVNVTVADAAPY